jgi:hypothetical protein
VKSMGGVSRSLELLRIHCASVKKDSELQLFSMQSLYVSPDFPSVMQNAKGNASLYRINMLLPRDCSATPAQSAKLEDMDVE